MDYLDANEAKVFVLLIGCHELVRFGCLCPIIEGVYLVGFYECYSSLEDSGLGGGGIRYVYAARYLFSSYFKSG